MIDKYLLDLKRMQDLELTGDPEAAHGQADNILCDVLTDLGLPELVEAFNKIEKWYA